MFENYPVENTQNSEGSPDDAIEGKDDHATLEEIADLAKEKTYDESKISLFVKFVEDKFKKPITRRNFMKLAGAALAASISYAYLKDNFENLWKEFEEIIENNYEVVYSKEMTALYEELKNRPEDDVDNEKVDENLKGISNEFEHAEFIKNSSKEDLDEMIDKIITNDRDVILFGEYHGVDSNAVNAVQILEKLMKKDHKKISKIGLEFLDFNDPKSIRLTEMFNNKQISSEDFYYKGGRFLSDIRPLLEFAQKNNILIEGLEKEISPSEIFDPQERAVARAVDMSIRAGSMAKEKSDDDILVVFSGAAHSSKSCYEEKKGFNHLSTLQVVEYTTQETAEQAVKKNYTFKEYLEKLGFRPTVIKLEDMNHQARVNNNLFGYTYNFLEEEEMQKYSTQWKKDWKNYTADRKEPFSTNLNDEKNSYIVVNPSEIPEIPPALNVFEEIRKKFPLLHKMICKSNYVDYSPHKYEMSLLAQTGSPILAKMATINLKSGKPNKIFLPEQLK